MKYQICMYYIMQKYITSSEDTSFIFMCFREPLRRLIGAGFKQIYNSPYLAHLNCLQTITSARLVIFMSCL